MSAVFGIYNLNDKPVESRLLAEMSEVLKHRGTDNSQIWTDGSVGFGHRMLWTTPESLHEELPKTYFDGNLTITADARIDNRDELINQIETLRQFSAKSIPDSEIILHAYAKWGEECTSKLIGDFAFAIYDKRNRRIFSARDHFGVKSLYYYYAPNEIFVFATELKALLQIQNVSREVDELKIADYLTGCYDDVSSTFYKHIKRLPASSQIIVTQTSKHISSYWSLDPHRELRLSSDDEYAERFRELFIEAVRCRMRSAFPIGSMLSGGLDSSSVACTAREILTGNAGISPVKQENLHTFSAVFKRVTKSDESPFIDAVLRKGNFEPHFLIADDVSPFADLEKILWHQDEAIQVGNLYINWHLYNTAQNNGVRVILDGFDGDTTVSHGTKYLLELAQSKRWKTLFSEARGYAKNFDESASALIWSYYWYYGVEPKLSGRSYLNPVKKAGRRISQWAMAQDKYAPLKVEQFDFDLNPEFVKEINLAEHHRSLRSLRPQHAKTEREDHYIQFLKGVTPFILENIDKSAAPFSLDIRYPFWDIRLAEFCLSLPAEQKMSNGYTRMVMRRAMKNILPEEVRQRPGKSDLSFGFNSSLERFEHARFLKLLKDRVHLLEKYINVDALPQIYERFTNGEATVPDILKISSSVSLALWLQSTELVK